MSLDRLNEAFKVLNALDEDVFDTSLDGINKLSSVMDADLEDEMVDVIDQDASNTDELQDTYVGKIILNCNVCHSHIFSNKEDVVIDESGVVNGEELCPYCGESEGFVIIGQIEEFDNDADATDDGEDPAEDASIEEPTEDAPTEESVENDRKNESIKSIRKRRNMNESLIYGKSSFEEYVAVIKKYCTQSGYRGNDVLHLVFGEGHPWSNSECVRDLAISMGEFIEEFIEESLKDKIVESSDVTNQVEINIKEPGFIGKKKDLEKKGYRVLHSGEGKITMAKDKPLEEKTLHEEPYLEPEFDSRQSFYNKAFVTDDNNVLYSYGTKVMEIRDGKPVITCREDQLSMTTMRHIREFLKQNGFTADSKRQIIRDYMTEGLTEGFNNVNVETDDQKLTMTQDENGKVTVSTEPIDGAVEGEGEMIAPISDEVEGELMTNATAEEEAPADDTVPVEDETPAEEEPLDTEEPAEEDAAVEESLQEGGASINRQQRWEDELIDLQLALEDDTLSDAQKARMEKRIDRLEGKFAKQRQYEKDHPEKYPHMTWLQDKKEKPAKEPAFAESVDVDFDDMDECSFNDLGERYLKSVYENVDSFETTAVSMNESTLIIEGAIKFKSGVSKKTGFVFEAMSATKDNKVRFVGTNKHLTESKRAFSLYGTVADKKLVLESLRYNYKSADNKVSGNITRNK